MKTLSTLSLTLALAASVMSASAVAAQAPAYPSKSIRMIIPFPPGGGSDLVARMVAQKLFQATGFPVIADNRAGAGGVIATDTVAKAVPDGYTLLWGTSSGMVINPLLSKDLPYDVNRDFAPVSMIAINPFLLVVNKDLPAKTFKDLIALAKAKPGQLNYSTPGSGSPAHLAMELLKVMTGTNIVHVPYKGAAAAILDIMAGRVEMKFNSMPAVLPLIKDGRLRALAITTPQRSKITPEIPTIIESGVPSFDVVTWYGLFLPAKTPKPIIDKLNATIVKFIGDEDMGQRLANDGAEARASTPAGLTKYMREEAERWKTAITAAPPV